MGGYPSRFFALFKRKDPRTPVKGIFPRLKNIARYNFRGLIGFYVPLVSLSWQGDKAKPDQTVKCMWIWMLLFFLIQPVNVPVTALIPIFLLPMAGVMSTVDTCNCYMNDTIVLFLLASMLLLLLNNTGFDRRIALWLLCSGDACQYSGKRLVFKCTTAAFFLSIFSNRLIVTSTITQFIAPTLVNLQSATARYRDSEPNFDEMRYVVCNSIQTASSIGSIVLPHTALTPFAMFAMFYASPPEGKAYPDIFNYFQYAVYAFPVAFLMHVLNFAYHMILINCFVKKPMSASSMTQVRSELLKHKDTLSKKVSCHEKLSVFFTLLYLAIFFTRWSKFMNMGWADFSKEETSKTIPKVKDATVAAVFVLLLHILPKGFGFTKFASADKKSELPPSKPESAILWWRFVDKNMNYGYIFMFGCGVALSKALLDSDYSTTLTNGFGKKITDQSWNTGIFLICLIAVLLSNVMTGVAACVVWCPFILNMIVGTAANEVWVKKIYLGALGVGIGTSFGFMTPFLYTPAYFCHYAGKVPKKRMVKYSIGSVIICLIILWLSLCLWAPFLWDPDDNGIVVTDAPAEAGATPKAAGEGDAAPPAEEGLAHR